MARRVLHILSQRPGLTGSGVTLDAMVRQASAAGWQQMAVVGTPADGAPVTVGDLDPAAIRPVTFAADNARGRPDLSFPVPGMSDVMPYRSSVWSTLNDDQLALYRAVWLRHLTDLVSEFAPDVIHSHHVWLVSSLLKEIAPDTRVVTTCHSTGLRQISLAPRLADEVRRGCARIDHFCVLRDDHGLALRQSLGLGPERVTVVGAGFRPEIFRRLPGTRPDPDKVLYVGKYSRAKGLPWLLAAWDGLRQAQPGLTLHIAGGGSGPEADDLAQQLEARQPRVIRHGQLGQADLADLMRQCGVCVLPSFYEGVPLVLVEAAACGARLVSTALPGVVERIQPQLADRMHLVPLPRMAGVDRPLPADLPRFVNDLGGALTEACQRAASDTARDAPGLETFTWRSVFARVQEVWLGTRA